MQAALSLNLMVQKWILIKNQGQYMYKCENYLIMIFLRQSTLAELKVLPVLKEVWSIVIRKNSISKYFKGPK